VLAVAGVAVFRLSEVVTASPSADPAARYVELEVFGDGCLFPSTVLRAYDPAGTALGEVAPFASTTCFAAGDYLLFATPAAQAAYATGPVNGAAVPQLPAVAGQLCLISSTTRYDCVRWGTITTPVHDLFGPADDTSAPGPPGGFALARVADVNVVEVDWRVETPTPRAPNDGTPWDPGDAGVDAAPVDGGPDDGGLDAPRPIDAPFVVDGAHVDANDRFLDLDPGGGAACGCGAGGGAPSGALTAVVLAGLLARRRRAR
jgi:MYXO-CTERM domain-containing protein